MMQRTVRDLLSATSCPIECQSGIQGSVLRAIRDLDMVHDCSAADRQKSYKVRCSKNGAPPLVLICSSDYNITGQQDNLRSHVHTAVVFGCG